MTPTVSIGTAAKNYAKYLPATIESVLAQSAGDWEFVIVDDGSTDATPDVVRPYLSDRRIRYVRGDRFGQVRAKNLATYFGRGEYVAFLDADDVWLPTKLEKQLALLRADPAVGVCFTRRSLIDEAGAPLPKTDPPPYRGRVLPELLLRNFVCFSSAMIRRQVFDHVGGFDGDWDLAIDFDFWVRAATHYPFDFVDEPLTLYRTGHGNLSKRLADRVAIADAIMNRAVFRRGLAAELPPAVVSEGFASTYRSLAYTLRQSEPLTAARWYLKALAWGGPKRVTAAKGVAASLVAWAKGKQVPGAAENASVNR